jgi:hypothetical protein
MKLQALLLSALMIAPLPAFAGHRRVYEESYCYRNTEQYVPGYYNEFGQYVGGYVKTNRKRVPCGYHSHRQYVPQNQHQIDNNSCIEGSVLGGIAGGGLGAALSRGDGRWWAIPLGIVGGSMVGCQIDGG